MVFRRSTQGPLLAEEVTDASYGRMRRRVFTLTAALVAILGLLYTLLQPTLYQSSATVLMSAPTAIDEQMLDADVQGVAIQRRTLTGAEITRNLTDALNANYGIALDPLELRSLLAVEPVPETNLLELSARGSDPELLPPLVETWVEVYTNVRASDIETRKTRTLSEVQNELDGLALKLDAARTALETYRAENEIISMERQENAVLSQLDGLNKTLNNAVEEEFKAKAYLDTLRTSLSAGEQVVPQSERGDVTAMSNQLAELKGRLSELRARYTDDYIRKDPRLREIPEQVDALEAELREAYLEGSTAELANAERAYRTAQETVSSVKQRLQEHKASVAAFNTIYAKHEALVEDLARLEELNRETQARQVQIQVRQVEKYPQVSVIDWPAPEAVRIGPAYLLLLGFTALAALVSGVFAVWLYSYLHPRTPPPAYVNLSGVHMYPQDAAQGLEHLSSRAARLAAAPSGRLTHAEEAAGVDSAPEDPDASGPENPDDDPASHPPDTPPKNAS